MHEQDVPDPQQTHDPLRHGPDYLPPQPAPWTDGTPVPASPPAPVPVTAPAAARTRHGLRIAAGVAVAGLLLGGGGVLAGHSLWPDGPGATTAASGGSAPGRGGGSGDGSGGSGGVGAGAGAGQPHRSTASTAAGQAAVAAVAPDLVDITTTIGYGQAEAAGTGIVLTPDGTVLTNHHVVAGATGISVRDVGNGQTYQGSVVGYDSTHDVAVIRLAGASGLATATVDQDPVTVGEQVVGVGNAGGLGGAPSAAQGTITALGRDITVSPEDGGSGEHLSGLVQTDAAIEPGDSGGALVDLQGEVVGMDTAASSANTTGRGAPEGFAIPISAATSIASRITSGEASSTVHVGPTAFLGVQLASGMLGYPTTIQGTVVAGVVTGSAADRLGLRAGDVITMVDGSRVDDPTALGQVIRSAQVGDTVSVTWYSPSGQPHSGSATLGAGPVG